VGLLEFEAAKVKTAKVKVRSDEALYVFTNICKESFFAGCGTTAPETTTVEH
jgi:hypothetical protein